MHPSRPSCRSRHLATILATAAVLATMAGAPLARAQGVAADGAAIVTNDGRTFPALALSVLESPPFRGTGLLPEGVRIAEVAPLVDAVPVTRGIESVIDTDERHQVIDTTEFPYRALVLLEIASINGNFFCTGFFIDADTVATAGHCVYGDEFGGWATSITAYPGRNGDDAPYGSATSTTFFAPQAWRDDQDHRFDYAAVKLDSALGTTVGWIGYGAKPDDRIVKANVRIFGYPADKPYGTMWGTKRKVKGVAPEKLFYKIDTFGGESGSPIYGKVSNVCQPCAFGIHAYGTGIEPYVGSNSGTRITADVFADLTLWATQ